MAQSSTDKAPERGGGTCPVCGKPADPKTRPFCSKRCADIDLARWLSGNYVIAGGHPDADEDGDQTTAQRTGDAAPGGPTDEER